MDLIYSLSGKELYNQAIILRKNRDYDNYMIYITMAANYDYQPAIDIIYQSDLYKKQNYSLTFKFYEETANNTNLKNSYSIHFLAYMYNNGYGVYRDKNKAAELYMIAIKKGNFQALLNIGYNVLITDYEKSIRIYEKAIINGDVSAYYKLGYMYINGLGVKQDYKKAIELYNIGIEKGNIDSIYYLALYYRYRTQDRYSDHIMAIKLFEEAITKGAHFNSIKELGSLYANCIGVTQNHKKAIELYEIVIEKGNYDYVNYVAQKYMEGIYVTKNYDKVIKLYKLGCECNYQNSIDAMTRLLKIKSLEAEDSVT